MLSSTAAQVVSRHIGPSSNLDPALKVDGSHTATEFRLATSYSLVAAMLITVHGAPVSLSRTIVFIIVIAIDPNKSCSTFELDVGCR